MKSGLIPKEEYEALISDILEAKQRMMKTTGDFNGEFSSDQYFNNILIYVQIHQVVMK